MVLCILCHIRISLYDGLIQGCFKYLIVFALRCWTMSYYDIVSYVYYVFFGHSLNMGLSFIVYGLK